MFQTSSKCYYRAVLLWSRPIVLATTLPNKEGSWVLGLHGSVAKILQNPVCLVHANQSLACLVSRLFVAVSLIACLPTWSEVLALTIPIFTSCTNSNKLYHVVGRCNSLKNCLFFFNIVVLLLSIITIITSCTVSSLIHKCDKVDDVFLAYPYDTVLAPSELSECQVNASVSLVAIQNQVHVYVSNCSSMNVSIEYNESDFHLTNITKGYSIIDVSHPSGSNYYAENTTVKVNASSAGSKVFFCLFNSKDNASFHDFLTTDDKDVFHRVTLKEPTCQELDGNDTAKGYTIDTTGYYFGGVRSLQLDVIQSINITLSVKKRAFHVSDDMETCVLFLTGHTCPVNQVYSSDTCILVDSIPLGMSHNFSYINIKADKVPESFFVLATLIPLIIGCCVFVIIVVVVIFWCIYKCCQKGK